MRILVTGGAGFVGSHLCERLLDEGHEVLALDDLSTGSSANVRALERRSGFELVAGSVLDVSAVSSLVGRVDRVFHLAAAVGVRRVLEAPRETFETNLEGTRSVLTVAARHRVPVVFTSTSEVYGRGVRLPFAEDDPLLIGATDEPRWSYAYSKAAAEALGFAHARENGLPWLVARLFNTVGPRQTGRYGMVVPRFVRQALAGEPLTVYGDGSQTRCFVHVRDTVRALTRLADTPAAWGRVFNVGSDDETSIETVAQRVRSAAESDSPIVHMPYREAYGVEMTDLPRRVPDLFRLRSVMGESARVPLARTLAELVAAERRRRGARGASAPVSGR